MKTIFSAILLTLGTIVFGLGICEISFPDAFSWTEVLSGIFPKLYRYGVWIGVAECTFATLLAVFAWFLDRAFARKGLETLFRLGIGGMFIFASWFKISDPKGFAILVAQYQFLPHDLVNIFALVMPMAEILFGFALIFTPFNRESASMIFLMFIAFMVALASALWRDLGITCGCFALEGAQDKSEAWTALIRDLILIGPTLWLTRLENRSLWKIWRK
jgi:hypothetical protein